MAVERRWQGDDRIRDIRARARELTIRGGVILQDEIKRQLNLRASPPPSKPGQPPAKLTGTLGRSIQVDTTGAENQNPSVEVGPDLRVAPYGRIHEFGGTIRPRNARMLAVPIGAEGRRAARQARGNLRSLDLVFVARKGKPPLLGRRDGKQFSPLFVLKDEVELPARPYMRPAFLLARPRIIEMYRREGLVGG